MCSRRTRPPTSWRRGTCSSVTSIIRSSLDCTTRSRLRTSCTSLLTTLTEERLDHLYSVTCIINAAFTPDTCSPDTSCIHLYPLSPSTCILYWRQNCRHGYYIYPLVSTSRTLLRTCIRLYMYRRIQVARPGYLYPATCIWCKRGLTVISLYWYTCICRYDKRAVLFSTNCTSYIWL